jgi:hypothetical protein
MARALGLPYGNDDFEWQPATGGTPMQHEAPEVAEEQQAEFKGLKDHIDDEAVLKVRLQEYDYRRREFMNDMACHMPLLRELSSQSKSVAELGVRCGNSTVALLMGGPKVYRGYDLFINPVASQMVHTLAGTATEVSLTTGDSLKTLLPYPTDTLLVDTLHTYKQLKAELDRHSKAVMRYIAIHDTKICARADEFGDKPGLMDAVEDFLKEHREWEMVVDSQRQCGMVVLARVGAAHPDEHARLREAEAAEWINEQKWEQSGIVPAAHYNRARKEAEELEDKIKEQADASDQQGQEDQALDAAAVR